MSDVDWAAVREAYEGRVYPLPAILRHFGLTRWKLRQRREKEDWATRPAIAVPGRLQGRSLRSLGPLLSQLIQIAMCEAIRIREVQKDSKLEDDGLARVHLLAQIVELIVKASRKPNPPQKKARGEAREKKNNNDARTDENLAWLRAELERRLRETRKGDGPK